LNPGPLALVGSGEYLPVMAKLEAELISGRGEKYVQIPTAAAQEGERSLNYWTELGISQANRLGVTPVPLIVRDRTEADDETLVEQLDGAGLIYFSGGNPHYLADTLRDTKLWHGIHQAWQNGAALAGCSAGAMAIANHIPALRNISKKSTDGLGVLPNIRVLPHFDRMFARFGATVLHRVNEPEGIIVVGIDEETALVGGPLDWEVKGRQSVWIFVAGEKYQFRPGQNVSFTDFS
jgi:cyanophycinase